MSTATPLRRCHRKKSFSTLPWKDLFNGFMYVAMGFWKIIHQLNCTNDYVWIYHHSVAWFMFFWWEWMIIMFFLNGIDYSTCARSHEIFTMI
jgi:hypothetical protein